MGVRKMVALFDTHLDIIGLESDEIDLVVQFLLDNDINYFLENHNLIGVVIHVENPNFELIFFLVVIMKLEVL